MFHLYAVNPVSVVFCFFFSSRRRHTRCLSDWSSDVCSSDLGEDRVRAGRRLAVMGARLECYDERAPAGALARGLERSEERRVGKEWRSRGAADQVEKRRV